MENIEPVNGRVVGYPTPTVGGPGAPSCYRVSLFSGSLEVTARLKSADDLELLVKVLEANKPLFAKADRLATEVLTLTQESDSVRRACLRFPPGSKPRPSFRHCFWQMEAREPWRRGAEPAAVINGHAAKCLGKNGSSATIWGSLLPKKTPD